MSTNYYLKKKAEPTCTCCNRPYEDVELHIGKSSAGWCFSLHVIPELGLNTLQAWKDKFNEEGFLIYDQYDREVTQSQMLQTICRRSAHRQVDWSYRTYWENKAEPGPFNLLRHKEDGVRCLGHEDGTWDLIAGEFS